MCGRVSGGRSGKLLDFLGPEEPQVTLRCSLRLAPGRGCDGDVRTDRSLSVPASDLGPQASLSPRAPLSFRVRPQALPWLR